MAAARSAFSSACASSSRCALVPPRVPLATATPRRCFSSTSPSFRKVSAPLQLGPTQLNRLQEHWEATLAEDLMYLTYDHRTDSSSTLSRAHEDPKARLPSWDPSSPYSSNRPARPPRGNRSLIPASTPTDPDNVVRLESVTVHTYVREAIGTKQQLLPAIMALRAITGKDADFETVVGKDGEFLIDPASSGLGSASAASEEGIQIVRAKSGVAVWKVRKGMPVGLKVELKGAEAHTFLMTLVEFVLPRFRSFTGVPLPPSSASPKSASATSGVVSFGLPPQAMALWPQIEVNFDSYPRGYGMQMDFKTNVRGKGAQEKARLLLSGFRVPFVRA